MKRLLFIIFVALCLCVPILSWAGTKTLNFAWNQDAGDLPTLTGWKIYVSEIAGGPYALLYTITYNGTPQQEYTSTQAMVSPDGQVKTYYFVATAFKPGQESGYSNEVSALIDFKNLSVPILFKLMVTTP